MFAVAQFTARRLSRALLTMWFAVTVTFFLLRLLPGDPASIVADPGMTAELRDDLIRDYGLDRPLMVQYWEYLVQLVHGNLGVSFRQNQAVLDILLERLPWTLLLAGTALLATVVFGVPLGVLAATRAGRLTDRLIQVGGITGQSLFVPSVGVFLLYVFGVVLGWLPIGGALDDDVYGLAAYASMARHLVLPATSLLLIHLGGYVLTLRTSLIEALGADYCELAKAKGVPYRGVVWKHALRNALLPSTTLIGVQLGLLVGGAVLTETIYAYPGVGRAIFEAVGTLDYPVLQGAFLMLAFAVIAANLLTDILYGLLDPRVRTS